MHSSTGRTGVPLGQHTLLGIAWKEQTADFKKGIVVIRQIDSSVGVKKYIFYFRSKPQI